MSYDNSAFPRKIGEQAPGLTKREYFAAKALQGILSDHTRSLGKDIAIDAVKMADHLIKALDEKWAIYKRAANGMKVCH